jgi:hypothetical protein
MHPSGYRVSLPCHVTRLVSLSPTSRTRVGGLDITHQDRMPAVCSLSLATGLSVESESHRDAYRAMPRLPGTPGHSAVSRAKPWAVHHDPFRHRGMEYAAGVLLLVGSAAHQQSTLQCYNLISQSTAMRVVWVPCRPMPRFACVACRPSTGLSVLSLPKVSRKQHAETAVDRSWYATSSPVEIRQGVFRRSKVATS